MTANRNHALSELLDGNEGSSSTLELKNGVENGNCDEQTAKAVYEEHLGRLKAEAVAEDCSRRLAVAQTQLTEYSLQKSEDVAELEKEADVMESLFTQLLQSEGDSEPMQQLRAHMETLKMRIRDVSGEAKAFAMQQKADLQRSQGVITQVCHAHTPLQGESEQLDELTSDMDTSPAETDSDDESETEILLENGNSHLMTTANGITPSASFRANSFLERSKYIPLRLSYEERNYLRLLEAALNVSEYTDKVDIMSWKSKAFRVQTQIKRICSVLSGLVVAQDYKRGQQLIQSRDFQDNAHFFQDIFEIGRRFKIMNPDKMRSEYGKLIYMLMDSSDYQIQELLEFSCVRPLKTVYSTLKEHDLLAILEDPRMELATAEVIAGNRPRYEVQRAIRTKERAREAIAKKYANRSINEEMILHCLYSIGDNNSFLLYNRDPIDQMISYLKKYFDPKANVTQSTNLAISMGCGGARLTHSHERQYQYVLQTLTLWREISNDMFKLWYLAESDLLAQRNPYRLQDTGQGFNRVQQAPQIRRAVFEIIQKCQTKIGHWVGSSVVHLGDHNVPNALMFIDKYTQVPRILNPIVLVLDELPKLCIDRHIHFYIDRAFGGVEELQKGILRDFFRHAFDGSGADNFFDAGSCIDGRLTSAWNWCSKIEKKPYYHVFKMAGFVGFDGDFQK